MVVYCYDLVRTRSLRFTTEMDAFLRAEWFQGLALAQLAQDFAEHFPKGKRSAAMMERLIANRLSELGVRNRKAGEAK